MTKFIEIRNKSDGLKSIVNIDHISVVGYDDDGDLVININGARAYIKGAYESVLSQIREAGALIVLEGVQ